MKSEFTDQTRTYQKRLKQARGIQHRTEPSKATKNLPLPEKAATNHTEIARAI